jgi:hypothetical protein
MNLVLSELIMLRMQVLSAAPPVVAEAFAERVRARKPRGPYRRYIAHQIEQLIDKTT